MGGVVATYSPDGGGRWLPAVATTDTITMHLSTGRWLNRAVLTPTQAISDTGAPFHANLVLTDDAEIAEVQVWLSITHTNNADLAVSLQSPAGTQVPLFATGQASGQNFAHTRFADYFTTTLILSGSAPYTGTYRPVGRLADFKAQAISGTWTLVITDSIGGDSGTLAAWGLRIKTPPVPHVYTWDTFASGFFGQSDNVVLRMVAYPQTSTPALVGTYKYTDSVPGPFQRPYASATTFPFRVRGTQVQVFSETVHISNTVENALVYRLPRQGSGGFPLADSGGVPFRTDHRGYLQGRGQIAINDTLLALLPVHSALHFEGALEFDGEDDYVTRNPLYNAPLTETTVSFWMRSEQTIGKGTPFSYASPLTDDTFLITNYNDFTVYRGDGINVATGVTATDGLWHHIAVTWRGVDGQVKLYKDGSAAYTGTLAAGSVISPDGSLVLGQNQNGASFFEGSLDEVHIWNVVLTETQILDDVFQPLNGSEPGLVAYWSFDDPGTATSGRCLDQSASGNDLRLAGDIWVGDSFGGYTVYHTSAVPTEDGLDAFTVSEPGLQVLTVTAEHPLILFDLDVSLEWDAHNDPVYLQQLAFDLQKASEYLYDFTNGQVALGQVTVHQNADYWASSHVAVQATNRLRPFASIGGIRNDVVTETVTLEQAEHTLTYGPGQVRMGATWNRYGNPGYNLGVDWPLILAHELSHYLLYQYDIYLGLDENGLLVAEDTCTGSAMGDVYVPNNTEFIYDESRWDARCADTLANKTLGRTEWDTLQSWYPWLVTPSVTNTGPIDMPFDFTTVTILSPTTEMDTLEDPMFYLDYEGQDVSSSAARAFLLRDGDQDPSDLEYVYDLGSPTGGQNRLLARGARSGDRLCVFDRPKHQYGCEVIESGDERLDLEKDASWTPVIQLSPVNSTTFDIQVSGLPELAAPLKARLYPEYGSAFTETVLSRVHENGPYSGTLDLAYSSMIGHVQVWISETLAEEDPRHETIVGYTIGGNPGAQRAAGIGAQRAAGIGAQRAAGIGAQRAAGIGAQRAAGIGAQRAAGIGSLRAGEAPVVSPDGQMILFHTSEITFAVGQFYTIQDMAGLPPLPPGRTQIGQGYNLFATGFPTDTPVLIGSVSFQYLGSDVLVAGADESDLTLYFWDGDEWIALDTVLDTYFNMASAPSQGAGVYALMTSVRIPLYGPGWNLVSYPLRGTETITEALRSISGAYAIVYGYVVTDTSDPWRVYGAGAPSYVNRLHEMRFGQGYWISVTEAITWYVGGASASETLAASAVQSQQNMPSPPATYYGPLLAGLDFAPAAGMAVTAWVDDNLCGRGRTLEVAGEVVYSIHVLADAPGGAAGCGAPGKEVTFQAGLQAMSPVAQWDNRQLWELALRPGWPVYLPLLLKH